MAGHPTPTPFQPLGLTPVTQPPGEAGFEGGGFFQPSYNYFGIDFANQRDWVLIGIAPPDEQVNHGKDIAIFFMPGDACVFGDGRACVSVHNNGTNNMVFLSIHSGVGGEGQAFRHAVEGTGINRAGFSLEEVQENLGALAGAEVSITQNGSEVTGFSLVGVTRIPASHVAGYLALPVRDALTFAAQLEPGLLAAIDPERPMLVFETCGWKMPGEAWYPGTSATTGSIYVGVIQNLP